MLQKNAKTRQQYTGLNSAINREKNEMAVARPECKFGDFSASGASGDSGASADSG